MKHVTYLLGLFILLTSCGSHDKVNPKPSPPAAAVLVFPDLNSICVSGNVISTTQSSIQFQWNAATNADSYTIAVKNLLTNDISSQTVSQTQATFTLARNTPFSWSVTSKSGQSAQTALSATWKFYNAGNGITSYAPFPADNMSPTAGQIVDAASGTVTLSWTGSDPDNDIASYDIYFGTTQTPPLYKEAYASTSIADVTVSPKTIYYWKVVIRDNNNNTSDSGVIQFQTK